MIVVGLLTLELYIPGARSLKEKRMTLRSVKERLKAFNVSVAEVEHQNLWQRAELGVVAVGSSRDMVDRTLATAASEIDRVEPGLVIRSEVEFLT